MYVTVSSSALATICADVAASGGGEACGLLLGSGAHVAQALPCRNVASDPSRRFEIDPAALLAAHREARGGGPAVLGHYHSHPGGLPIPSPRDAADAAPDGLLWLIAGSGEARLWRAVADGAVESRFDPVACAPMPCAADATASKGAP